MLVVIGLIVLSALGAASASTEETVAEESLPAVELADSVAALLRSVLDSCAARLDELSLAVRENPTSIQGMDIEGLYRFLIDLQSDIDSAEAGRFEELVAEARQVYTMHLINLDVLPADLMPSLLLEELDVGGQDTLETADTQMVELATGDMVTAVTVDTAAFTAPPTDSLTEQPTLPPIPLLVNTQVEQVISYYCRKGRKVVQRWLDRSSEMIPRLLPILREEGMPDELVYLAMIESGFNPQAYSRARASGVWQFIPGTGRRYGLRNDWWYDERRDPELATRAAAAYLRELYNMFGDWYLAMAAYNCGERKVAKHVAKYGNDFWALKRLPRQTKNYVPAYLAARIIATDPGRYGFYKGEDVASTPTETVYIKGSVDLNALAEAAGTTGEELRKLNPALLRWCTPPEQDSLALHLPAGAISGGFWDKFAQIPEEKRSNLTWHRVRSGETLSTIARKYGVTVAMIADHPQNGIRNVHRLRVGQMLAIPGVAPQRRERYEEAPVVASADGYHTVRQGETLQSIGIRYGVTVEQLQHWNQLGGGSLIYPRQKLRVSGDGEEAMLASATPEIMDEQASRHLVRSGDTLWDIARRYGVTVEQLKQANGLGRRSLIKPGQRLLIPAKNKT